MIYTKPLYILRYPDYPNFVVSAYEASYEEHVKEYVRLGKDKRMILSITDDTGTQTITGPDLLAWARTEEDG